MCSASFRTFCTAGPLSAFDDVLCSAFSNIFNQFTSYPHNKWNKCKPLFAVNGIIVINAPKLHIVINDVIKDVIMVVCGKRKM